MRELLEKLGFVPARAVWELTLRCNLNCRHCGSRAGKARTEEMSVTRGLKLCEELAALGCKRVTLGGGEPTLNPSWALYAAKLTSLGVTVTMTTNGLCFDRDLAMQAKMLGLESLCFSLDGMEETHEYIRRVPGHFKKLVEAFDVCREVGIPAVVITTLNQQNFHELDDIQKLLADHGVYSWQLQLGNPTGNMCEHRELVLPPEMLLEIVPKVAQLKQSSKRPQIYVGDNIGYYGDYEAALRSSKARIPFWTGCRAGCRVIGIESGGNVKGCLSLPSEMNGVDRFIEGNIMDKPLAEIWNKPGAFAYNRQFKIEDLGGECRTCEYAEICRGGCFWTSYAHTLGQRDNPYCYIRQLKHAQEKAAAKASESSESKTETN